MVVFVAVLQASHPASIWYADLTIHRYLFMILRRIEALKGKMLVFLVPEYFHSKEVALCQHRDTPPYRQMLIERPTASVFIFNLWDCPLTVEFHLTPVRFSGVVFFVKRASESPAPIGNKLHVLNGNYKDNKYGYNWDESVALHNN